MSSISCDFSDFPSGTETEDEDDDEDDEEEELLLLLETEAADEDELLALINVTPFIGEDGSPSDVLIDFINTSINYL
jgi:hypothetical protein